MARHADGELRSELAATAARYGLPEGVAEQLATVVRLVATDSRAPTTVRSQPAILRDHIADSLVALNLAPVRSASTIADRGSGAGFPGIPLAIALPAAQTTLVETSSRKCAFIGRAIEAAGVRNAQVENTRVEDWEDGLAQFDVVTARALAPLSVVAEYSAPVLRVGGTLVAWRGRRDHDDEARAARAAHELGLEPGEIRQVKPYEGAEHRFLHLMLKVRETPDKFPRRPGMARKRPLGGA